MGNSSSGTQNKSSGTASNTGVPDWATPGTDAYNNMNQWLQTSPMAVAGQTFAQGGQGTATQNAIDQMMSTGNNSTDWTNQAAGMAQNIGQITPGTISDQNYQSVYNQAGSPGAGEQYLTGTAQGQYLGGSPYLDDIIAKGSQNVADQTNALFAAGGRYGSAAHQGTLADSINSYAGDLRNQNYQAERDRQLSAANALEGAQQGRLGIQSGAAGGVAGVQGQNVGNSMNAQGQNIGNQLSAAGLLGNLGQQGANNLMNAAGLENQGFNNMLGMIGQLGNIQNNKVFDAQQQQNVGSQIDQRAQQQLSDLINQWNQTDMQDWSRLGGLLSIGQGSAGNWGTQTSTSSQPANVAGILGGLLGLFSSDRRMKENIEPAGERNGFKLYDFNYRGNPDARWRGVMADEVQKIKPEAVHKDASGYLVVDYSKLGFSMERV